MLDKYIGKLRSHKNSNFFVFLILLTLTIAMRYFSFTRSVIDWDESTYILISEGLLSGKSLYLDVWDNKPPGIFLIFSSVQLLFENAIPALRILSALIICLTAFLLFKIVNKLYPNKFLMALLSGVFYVNLISFNGFSFALSRGIGLEVNTEMFFIFFTVFGFYIYLKNPCKYLNLFLSGLLLGLGFIIKYLVLFDMIALGLIVILQEFSHRQKFKTNSIKVFAIIKKLTPVIIGCLLPFFLTMFYFYLNNRFDSFWHVTFEVGKNYSSEFNIQKLIKFIGDFFYLGGAISLCFGVVIYSLFRNKKLRQDGYVFYWLLWMLLTLVGASITGKYFFHYLYPVFPAFALLSSYVASNFFNKSYMAMKKFASIIILFIITSIPIVDLIKYKSMFEKEDVPKTVANYINNRENKPKSIFIHNYKHIIHYHTNTLPLTKYYHPSLLYRIDHIKALGIDAEVEHKKIFSQQPDYVICQNNAKSETVNNYLEKDYSLINTFNKDVFLYARNHN